MTRLSDEDLARFIAEGGQTEDPWDDSRDQEHSEIWTSIALVEEKKKRRSPEHDEQVALFRWADMQIGIIPELALLFAIPNGGDRHPAVAAKMKAEGVKRGVPDICLPVARGGHHALYIEMKAENGRVRPDQNKWLQALADQGNQVEVHRSWERARDAILYYLNG